MQVRTIYEVSIVLVDELSDVTREHGIDPESGSTSEIDEKEEREIVCEGARRAGKRLGCNTFETFNDPSLPECDARQEARGRLEKARPPGDSHIVQDEECFDLAEEIHDAWEAQKKCHYHDDLLFCYCDERG